MGVLCNMIAGFEVPRVRSRDPAADSEIVLYRRSHPAALSRLRHVNGADTTPIPENLGNATFLSTLRTNLISLAY